MRWEITADGCFDDIYIYIFSARGNILYQDLNSLGCALARDYGARFSGSNSIVVRQIVFNCC